MIIVLFYLSQLSSESEVCFAPLPLDIWKQHHLKCTDFMKTSNFHLFMTSGTKKLKSEILEEKKPMKWEINQYQGTNTQKTLVMEMSQSRYIPESDLQR